MLLFSAPTIPAQKQVCAVWQSSLSKSLAVDQLVIGIVGPL